MTDRPTPPLSEADFRIYPEAKEAAKAFRDFLLEGAQQNALAEFFYDPANTGQSGVGVDGLAIQRLLD